MAKIKIGIVGCGGIANQKHLPSLTALKDRCELVAFCDIIPERAEKACKEYGADGAKTYTDYHELLSDKSIEVVHVLTPNVSHCQITVDAFAAGKHVMCEKPMAATSADAQAMMDAWKKSGKQFTIGYQNRYRNEIQMLKTACERGDLGDIYYARAHALRRRGVPTWGVFTDKAKQGGGPLIDIGTHALDLTLWMMDNYEPASVSGSVFYKLGNLPEGPEGNMMGPWDPTTFEVEDSAFGLIKMKNGATIYLEAAWAINLRNTQEAATTLAGTKAGAEILSKWPAGEVIFNRAYAGNLTEESMSNAGAIAYFSNDANKDGTLEATRWLDAVEGKKDVLIKPEQAFRVTQLLEAIYKSSETGKEIVF